MRNSDTEATDELTCSPIANEQEDTKQPSLGRSFIALSRRLLHAGAGASSASVSALRRCGTLLQHRTVVQNCLRQGNLNSTCQKLNPDGLWDGL